MEAFSLLKYWRGTGPLPLPPSFDDNDNDGPFFDLEFTVPVEEDAHEILNANHTQEEEEEDINVEESDGEREFEFSVSPSSNDRSELNLSLSPSDDLLLKGKVDTSEPNSKPQFTASLLKSAAKFRVFMLGLKKPKPTEDKKHFTVKYKLEEVPIVSLFSSKPNKHHHDQDQPSEEKRFSKEVLQKYFKMVKPLYIRVSRRYGDKHSFNSAGEANANSTIHTQKLPSGLCKHLGKSRSASSAVAAAPPAFVSSKRRDDSLLQQQDGIQGAILHCKRSFNASTTTDCESFEMQPCVSQISINEPKAKDKPLST